VTWRESAEPPLLEEGQVHVWRAPLRPGGTRLAELGAQLSEGEIARADRLRFEPRRSEATVSRGTLRELLGGYLGRAPSDVHFRYGPQAKPALREAEAGLHFNVAHSDEVLLIAVTRLGPVGIDVEKVRPDVAFEEMARRYFSESERAALAAAPDAERPAAFFRGWTRKEAFLKALGTGFAFQVTEFSVGLDAGGPASLATAYDPAVAARWQLSSFEPADGYVGAIAVEAPAVQVVRLFRSGDCRPRESPRR
jgi:4'-phosphopantetheinyl transferase